MTNWKCRDTILRGILARNDDENNEAESVTNTKKELIPYLKTTPHFKMLPSSVITEMELAHTFHAFNRQLDKVFDFADENLIWIELA